MIRFSEWYRGVILRADSEKDLFCYFWFYEYNVLDAVMRIVHGGADAPAYERRVNPELASIDTHRGVRVELTARPDGAELRLEVENRGDYDWPAWSALEPCFNAGTPPDRAQTLIQRGQADKIVPLCDRLYDGERQRTFFVGPAGLMPLTSRDRAHYDRSVRPQLEQTVGPEVLGQIYPPDAPDAVAAVMLRQSTDRRWVMAIAWESFLFAQGFNPWNCMHLAVRVGPLARGQKRTIRGRIYLYEGTVEDCLHRAGIELDWAGNAEGARQGG